MERLTNIIKQRIRWEGPISFARFMEMALYYPGLGYYASGRRRTGASGDYYTSPQAHPAFGALLALQLERMWQVMGRPSPFHVLEAGAGDRRLAREILEFSRWLEKGFRQALVHVAVDVNMQPVCQRNVGAIHESPLRAGPNAMPPLHAVVARTLPFRGLRGCILSNELLDAFPVHRLVVEGNALKEVYVALNGDALADVLGEPSSPALDLLGPAAPLPPEGSVLEICPGIWAWMAEAARALESGFVLTIDYGYWEAPGKVTVASYRRHAVASPYEMVGEQDLTAHVDFGAAMEAGRRAGLAPLGLLSQRRFLLELGLGAFQEAAGRLRLPQRRHQANQMAMLDLVRAEGLGSFGVMVQYKGAPGVQMSELALARPLAEQLAAGQLPVPLLGKEHVPLLEGRYPHMSWDVD